MKTIDCPHCDGYGRHICHNCNGLGSRHPERDGELRCYVCGGGGEVGCGHCDGEGRAEVEDDEDEQPTTEEILAGQHELAEAYGKHLMQRIKDSRKV